eukprot:2255167-Prymnesium_polylepis.1
MEPAGDECPARGINQPACASAVRNFSAASLPGRCVRREQAQCTRARCGPKGRVSVWRYLTWIDRLWCCAVVSRRRHADSVWHKPAGCLGGTRHAKLKRSKKALCPLPRLGLDAGKGEGARRHYGFQNERGEHRTHQRSCRVRGRQDRKRRATAHARRHRIICVGARFGTCIPCPPGMTLSSRHKGRFLGPRDFSLPLAGVTAH